MPSQQAKPNTEETTNMATNEPVDQEFQELIAQLQKLVQTAKAEGFAPTLFFCFGDFESESGTSSIVGRTDQIANLIYVMLKNDPAVLAELANQILEDVRRGLKQFGLGDMLEARMNPTRPN